jgi:hypothetical protein
MDGHLMGEPISIDPRTGSINVGEARLKPLDTKAETEPLIANLLDAPRFHENGYEWVYLRGLTFGGQPASMGLCFHNGRLEQASWSVQLPNAPMQGDWPTREAIDDEIAFVRGILASDGMDVRKGAMEFFWGEVWSDFDAKGFLASNGLRYRIA